MPREIHSVLPPVILGCSVNLLAGAPGTGKTAFTAMWVKRIQSGLDLFGLQPPPAIYQAFLAADRSYDLSTRLWFDAQQCDPLPHYSLQDDRAFKKSRLRRKQDRIAIFAECLDALSPTGDGKFPGEHNLIYVDPLALFLGGNLLDYDTCLVACSELREICLDRHVTIFGTAHASKQKGDKKDQYIRLQDRILGSAALFGYTDTQLYLASPEETGKPTYVFLWAPHHAKTQMFELTRDDQGLFIPQGAVGPDPLPPAPTDADWLLTALETTQRWTSLIELAEAQGVSKNTLYRRIKALEQHGQVLQVSRGEYRRRQVS